MRLRMTITFLKIAAAAWAVGTLLSYLNITVDQVLADLGLTHDQVLLWLDENVRWALPNMLLGLIIILPVWIIIFLFSPPRG